MPDGPEKPKRKMVPEDPVQAAFMIGRLATGEITEDEVEGMTVYRRTIIDGEPDDGEEAAAST